MNTHYFDGKLHPDKAFLEEQLLRAASISKEQKISAFLVLKNKLSPHGNLNTIITDFQVYGHVPGPNYDPTNDLYADDLLYLCAELVEKIPDNTDLVRLLNEQLQEMSSGMCAQGRTHRLISIVLAFSEFF